MSTHTASPARARTRGQRFADGLITRVYRLPPATSDYVVERDVRIPARDGVDLLADVYAPRQKSSGTVLVRSPYGFPTMVAAATGALYARRGYHVVLVRCRGTFGSGGTFDPMGNEVEDGADTVAWLREQPWFGGRFATCGGSYLGFTQWALLMDPPPELVAAVISIGPHDFHSAVYQGGAFNLIDFLGWSNMTSRQEEGGFVRAQVRTALTARRVERAARDLPLLGAAEALMGGRAPWYREWVTRRDPADRHWSRMILGDALDRVQVPILLQTGWHDLFLQQTMEQYAHLAARGIDVALTVGPWAHIQLASPKGGRITIRETLDWFDEHLAGSTPRTRAAAVKVFVTGAGSEWRELRSWPPAATDRALHPLPSGRLADTPAAEGSVADFTYDPADPTPTIGGRVLTGGAHTNDSALATRRDVVAFTGDPLPSALEVIGTPFVELAHSSDNPNVDLFVRLSEVDPKGRSFNVSDGFVRLDPAASEGALRLELDAMAHRFAAGNRIRLLVAGGSHPRWERNLGTGEDPATSSRTAPSHRTIDLASTRLVLPVTA